MSDVHDRPDPEVAPPALRPRIMSYVASTGRALVQLNDDLTTARWMSSAEVGAVADQWAALQFAMLERAAASVDARLELPRDTVRATGVVTRYELDVFDGPSDGGWLTKLPGRMFTIEALGRDDQRITFRCLHDRAPALDSEVTVEWKVA